MVVVCSLSYGSGKPPMVPRGRNASGDSFEVRIARADSSTATVSGIAVHCMVVEEGTYTTASHGIKMEAVKYVSTVTDRKGSWNGTTRSYQNTYTSPVVLGQVMTYNDADWSVFWARGSSRSSPPSSTTLRVGKHVAEDTDTSRANETIGYIVLEAGSGTMSGVDYVAALGADTIRGYDNSPPFSYSLSGLSSTSAAVVSSAAMDGGNGGWPILYGTSPVSTSSLNLAYDEDQIKDNERKHITEQVAYIVFE
jgi:hypothetical protein